MKLSAIIVMQNMRMKNDCRNILMQVQKTNIIYYSVHLLSYYFVFTQNYCSTLYYAVTVMKAAINLM